MSVTAGAPDPTFGDVQGQKSQWQLSLDQLESRLTTDLDSLIRDRLLSDYSRSLYVVLAYNVSSRALCLTVPSLAE